MTGCVTFYNCTHPITNVCHFLQLYTPNYKCGWPTYQSCRVGIRWAACILILGLVNERSEPNNKSWTQTNTSTTLTTPTFRTNWYIHHISNAWRTITITDTLLVTWRERERESEGLHRQTRKREREREREMKKDGDTENQSKRAWTTFMHPNNYAVFNLQFNYWKTSWKFYNYNHVLYDISAPKGLHQVSYKSYRIARNFRGY